ncbi:MAG: PD-(D/E)XK nuclease family protein, partial [Bacteroidaceae bacterium]|nr:PD-(D/E)XK nuclease family protein [Bacteroidaceae bacterium]
LTMRVETFAPRLNFLQSNESQRFVASLGDEMADSQTYTDIGKIMHYVLSQVRTLDDVPRVLEACRKDGIIEDERMSKRVFERLNKGFSNPKVRHWFTDGEAINENNIIGCSRHRPEQKVHRPDRVVLTDTDVTVIDYKFGRKNTDYHNQVRAYMDLLHQMYPTRHVEGYLWYVYSGEVVSVPETDNI